ncbi:Hsp20/alpha crystallin family protein, partial [Streptomyces sp. NPDC006307]|uniref:Hsp20/alpha crystallin family protein n=1 Tax=Streptomyces sp. NPDC006307 TaxID=3156748 RepID=UPI0033BE743A
QLFLGETLDTDRIEATYDMGVLTLRIPVARPGDVRDALAAQGEQVPWAGPVTAPLLMTPGKT